MFEKYQKKFMETLTDKKIFEIAERISFEYMDNTNDRSVYPSNEDLKKLQYFYEPLPQGGGDEKDILLSLYENGFSNTVAQTGGRYYGFVNGGALPVTIAVKWIADVWDQNAVLYVASPVASVIEDVCEKWVVELLNLPEQTAMGLVGGSSDASLCALTAARNSILKRQGWDIYHDGLTGAPPIKVVLSNESHGTIFKALSVLGFGSKDIIRVDSDTDGTISLDQLPDLDDRTLLILQAGNVNTGAFDKFDSICDIANSKNTWIHIDGAFGLWAQASQSYCRLTKGIEKADSWSVDAHKTLNIPYDCGIVLCRTREALYQSLQANGDYIQYSDQRDGMLYTTAMSRRARAFELWAAIKCLGKEGIGALVEHLCKNAEYFADLLTQYGFTILNNVTFNQVLIHYESDEMTKLILEYVQKEGVCWCGKTQWKGKTAIRLSVCSWVTTAADVEISVNSFVRGINYADSKREDHDRYITYK